MMCVWLCLLLLNNAPFTSAFRLVDNRDPVLADSYIAAVGQTIFSDGGAGEGGGCCPSQTTGACPGAEPLGKLPPCNGTLAQAMNETKMGNLANFERMMEAAAAKGAQIIVFSEGALGIADGKYKSGGKMVDDGGGVAGGVLAEPIPEPIGAANPIVPCDFKGAAATAAPALVALSCAAKKYKIHVVYDTGDAVKCAPKDPYNSSEYCYQCPPEGIMRFNTQVAIGDDGKLLAKYHKTHRYLASHCIGDGYQNPGGQDPRWFDTSFGVRFGMMLCYDICFHTPGIELAVGAHQISDFVFSTHWENEEGPPISLATSFFQSWSRGVGANLLAANEGMGLMHTGSGIFSQGNALASTWEPANPHDEALLIATVPKLHGKSKPMYAGGKPPTQPWGTGQLSPNGPVFTVIDVSADGKDYSVNVSDATNKGVERPFSCSVNFTTTATTSDTPLETEQYALVGVNGSWISSHSGGLPARGCAFYRIPASSITSAGGIAKWKPWSADGGAALYRTPLNTTVPADLGGSVSIQALSIEGNFRNGDIVRPQLAGMMGKALGYHIRPNCDGRGFNTEGVRWSEPVTQAMLLVNSHESAQANPKGGASPHHQPHPPNPPTPCSAATTKQWVATGCTAACAAVPQNVKAFWATQNDLGAADMFAYCEATRNGTATPLQKRICGSVRGGRCSLQRE